MKQRWQLSAFDVVKLPNGGGYAVEATKADDEARIHTTYGVHEALLYLRRAVDADLRRIEDDMLSPEIP
jgi:hypothetical protein